MNKGIIKPRERTSIFFVCLHQQKLKNPYMSATKSCMKTINSSTNSSGELDSIEYF